MTGAFIQAFAVIAALAMMAGMYFYLIKKKQRAQGLIEVLSYQSIGQKNAVAALKIGTDVMVLGLTQSDMKVLKVLKAEDLRPGQERVMDRVEKLRKMKEAIDGQPS